MATKKNESKKNEKQENPPQQQEQLQVDLSLMALNMGNKHGMMAVETAAKEAAKSKK